MKYETILNQKGSFPLSAFFCTMRVPPTDRMDVKKSRRVPLQTFWHYETVQNSHFSSISRKFLNISRGSALIFFDILQQNGCVKISKVTPFTFFGTMRLLKIFIFRLILGFLNSYSTIIFFRWCPIFLRPAFISVLCDFFLICFH